MLRREQLASLSICGYSRPARQSRPAAYHNISLNDAMPAEGLTQEEQPRFTHRNIEYRLLPGSKANGAKLDGLAGACRYVWNRVRAEIEEEYREGQEKRSLSYFSLFKRFTALRREVEWLPDYASVIVRYTLKYQADAWKAFFKKAKAGETHKGESPYRKNGLRKGTPNYKSKNGSTPSFTIPDAVKIKNGKLHIPKVGYLKIRRRGGNPYPDGKPVKAVVRQRLGKWYATICYEVEAPELPDNGVTAGVDRNCGQYAYAYTTTAGEQGFLLEPQTKKEKALLEHEWMLLKRKATKKKRYQRKLARQQQGSGRRARTKRRVAKWSQRIANARKNRNHRASKAMAAKASTVSIEALKIKNMTASAKGTVEAPGKNVKQKAGLNREILAAGWGQFELMLGYKCRQVIKVPAPYTSLRCNVCGHTEKDNRKTQKTFKCVACGHKINADYNASANILASGTGAAARGGAWPLGPPMSREMDALRTA